MGRDNGADGWCILRCAPARTLLLAASLIEGGIEAWSPITTIKKRKPGGRSGTVSRDVPLTPTFVFARAASLPDLHRALRDPSRPHPPFSIFRYLGGIPILADAEVERLRLAERRAMPKGQRRTFAAGSTVKPTEGPYAGMSGVVKHSDGRFTLVAFGGWMDVKIETFAIRSGDVREIDAAA
ncbi:MAG: hypothetical protein INR68_17525 [Methylobacterium mesophilicum]|nr:hypothetical protein [Methylobacterium mesophilicum]